MAALAAVAGAHFLPYSWLHRTRVYLVLAVAVSLGSWALALTVGNSPHRVVLVWWALCYVLGAAALVRIHRHRVSRERQSAPGPRSRVSVPF